ncbi:hypothetical protein JX265_006556 [Neoarthrinium moseri]|uniref:Protein kinase domain-containing protein n=1 Tax=Neoarthrinium moseri TaxID=1658444 RepID=A0A9Q0AQ80_9PEZI|nr:hypothetical protein JX265_006556 [Neoarthrinium moseri]
MLRRGTTVLSFPSDLIGATGRRYVFSQLIQERPHVGRVWLATSGSDKFILKDVPNEVFAGFKENILPRFRGKSVHSRLPLDTISDQRVLVYRYLTDDFSNLVNKGISMRARKQILKASLLGIAELHDYDIVHLDIKPDNIMVDCHGDPPTITVEQVQIADLENAAYLPKGRCIKGMLAGNDNWRSPEAHLKGELNKPADIFSFGVVCIFAMLGRVILGPDDDFRKHMAQGAFPAMIRLQRQVSYFGDQEGLDGLMKHVGDEEVSCQILKMLWEDRKADYIPYDPFSDWTEVEHDAPFRDLIRKLTDLDPSRRVPARQALEHTWFEGVDY